MRGHRGWLLANTLGGTLMIAIAEIYKWHRIAQGGFNRPSIPQELVYVRRFFLFAVLLGALQVALCYGVTRVIPIRNRILGATYGTITGILLPLFGVVPAHVYLAAAGALTARTTPRS